MAVSALKDEERAGVRALLSFDNMRFRYEPYPIGVASQVMDPAFYDELVDTYPPIDLFKFMPKFGQKYTLSQKFNAENYHDYIAKHACWKRLHSWIKSEGFVAHIEQMLLAHGIDLGLDQYRIEGAKKLRKNWKDVRRGRLPRRDPHLRTRFEFSMLAAHGGSVIPHTDTPRKIITLILSMIRDGEWDPSFGGGTDVNRPADPRKYFNRLNRPLDFDEVEILDTFEYRPNQCVVFVKTFNSLHSVRPMTGTGGDAMRKTLTINIETDE